MSKNYVTLLTIAITLLIISSLCSFMCSNETNHMQSFNDNDYLKEWKIIDELEQKGLPKSALEKVEELYEIVKKEENPAQSIKCIIYRAKYQSQLEEDGLVLAMNNMEKEMETASFPVKSVLQSLLAEFYTNYLNQNRWKIQQRTNTINFENADIQTWTYAQFSEKIMGLYKSSVQSPDLRKVKIKDFDAITTKPKNTDQERPTLFDFLAHRAIDYFVNDQSYLVNPTFQFYLTNENLFDPAPAFVKIPIETEDIKSGKFNALVLMQELIEVHINDSKKEALINADLKRLKFVFNNSTSNTKDELYLKALNTLKDKDYNSPASAEILYELGAYYYNKGTQYSSSGEGQTTNQFAYVEALKYLEEAVEKFPESFGGRSASSIINNIRRKDFNLSTEKVVVPNKPLLALINYKNVNKLYFKIVKSSSDEFTKLQGQRTLDQHKTLNQPDPIKEWSVDLPDPKDYQTHQVEIKLDGLPLGQYFVLASNDKNFKFVENGFVYTRLHVSNISHWNKRIDYTSSTFVVTDRSTGAPMQGVTGTVYQQKYNNRTRVYDKTLFGNFETDKNGFVQPNVPSKGRYIIIFSKGDDVLDLNDYVGANNNIREQREHSRTHFFLDRKIYRPGQTVYFKGLVLNYDKENLPNIVSNKKVEVTFFDVNRQVVEKKEFVTNSYGTINGTFEAPKGGLLGQMNLHSSVGSGSISFKVEEYKRPKFEVKVDPVKGSYKLNDMVTVTGLAKAYAGSNIDGAEVKYRVVRNVNYPYFPWWRYGYFYRPPNQGASQEIAFGTTKTDASGKFTIEFEAKPNKTSKKEDQPVFTYEVSVDVVDITGETHSSKGSVRIGYIGLSASVQLSDPVNSDSLKSIGLTTQNLNGEFEPAKGTVKISSVKTPEVSYVKRYWSTPDQWLLSEQDYNKDFPKYAYKNKDQKTNWPVDKLIKEFSFDTEQSKKIDLSTTKLPVGTYLLVMNTEDKFGNPIELRKHFTVYDLDTQKVPSNEVDFFVIEKFSYEPGEKASFYIGSLNKPAHMLYEVIHKGKVTHSEWLTVDGLTKQTIDIEEKHRGNLSFHVSTVVDNRFYEKGYNIVVPFSNKLLDLEFSTFRDKLYPGQDEEWRIKITGQNKDKVAAEMVAAMYDASLDAFAPNDWANNFYPTYYSRIHNSSSNFNASRGLVIHNWKRNNNQYFPRDYRYLNWFGFNFYGGGRMYADGAILESAPMSSPEPNAKRRSARADSDEDANYDKVSNLPTKDVSALASTTAGLSQLDSGNALQVNPSEGQEANFDDVAVRTNLNETVFFFPDLMTDKDGNVIVKFKMNEALTRWKFLAFAHTKDFKTGYATNEVLTQKDLMVMPNAPRFFREGDELEFTAKVSNLTDKKMDGTAIIQFFNAITNEPVNHLLGIGKAEIPFTAEGGQSARLAWTIKVPTGEIPAITHKVIAKAGKFSDGEESGLPVLTNRMLVTETMPLPVRGKETKEFKFKKLANAGSSSTLQHHKVTLEFTSNPAWYAVQALPYMMEYPYKCTEQIFSRYYANSLATSIANSHPKIKSVFDSWKDSDAMLSNLTKNEELKSALLEETPWVLQAQSEEKQKQNVGLLFDLTRMAQERDQALNKLKERQMGNGGFAWFPGGRDSWYITQHLVEGFGHLDALGVDSKSDDNISSITNKAVLYTDDRLVDHYNEIKRRIEDGFGKWEDDHLSQIVIHYLYSRSFYPEIEQNKKTAKVVDFFMGQVNKYWVDKNQYLQGMLALTMHRNGDKTVPADIVKSLRERSLYNDEMGMYWKYNRGYYWYQLPIETHSMMIEVFDEVAKDAKAVDDLKVWLLKNKQTNHWKTTKATASAVYALLGRGDNWLLDDALVDISMGGKKIDSSKLNPEPGTGYIKTSWDTKEIEPTMANVKVSNPNNVVAWGAMYWQYFEQLDKITTFEETPLALKKQLFLEENTDSGPKISPVTADTKLKPGDKLKVRIELRVDRAMEYIHMKDMRASGFEPMNTNSQYKWQAGLGYYESTRDASTNFFFSRLPKGTHVFEYPLRVNHKGDFSNGITTIQCMYAPEFTSHSEGVRVTVE